MCPTVNINVWWISGAYVLIAISEIFASVTMLEYAFSKAPVNMRSLVMAIGLFSSGIASAIEEAFVVLAADPLLVWLYGSVAVISALGGMGFWFSFRKLDLEEDRLNMLPAGHFEDGQSTETDDVGTTSRASTHCVSEKV